MHIVHVDIHVRPEAVEAFRTATLENARHSVHEPGIARFDVLQAQDDPTRFRLVEVFRDAEAPARHRETAHYQAWAQAVEPLQAEPRSRNLYHNIFPDDPGWG